MTQTPDIPDVPDIWRRAELDAVDRMLALARAVPGAAVVSAEVECRPDRAWELIGDIEVGQPRFELLSRRHTLLSRDGPDDLEHEGPGEDDRIVVAARTLFGTSTLHGVLRPGWCLMGSARTLVGMAAAPHGDGARIVHMEAWRWPGARLVGGFLGPKVRYEMWRIRRLLDRAPDDDVRPAGAQRGVRGMPESGS